MNDEKGENMSQIYIIPKIETLEESCSLAEEWGVLFEYNDFYLPDMLDDEKGMQRRIKEYKAIGRDTSKDTLHGAFFDVTIHSSDSKIRELSRNRVCQSMNAAEQLGVRAVIFHTNFIPGFDLKSYKDMWIEVNCQFWEEMLLKYPSQCIYLENMFDQTPELLAELAKRMKHNRFGVCFDYAHGAVSATPLEEWVHVLAPYIKHIHINDNDHRQDLHLAMGEGKINWNQYQEQMIKYHVDASVVIEVSGIDKQKVSLDYMKKKGLYPI